MGSIRRVERVKSTFTKSAEYLNLLVTGVLLKGRGISAEIAKKHWSLMG